MQLNFTLSSFFARCLLLCGLVYVAWSLSSCRKPFNFKETGSLSFSTDSVKFDTIFTTLPSPTRRLVFRNNSGNHLRIKNISLQNGAQSDFRLIINGDAAQSMTDFELAKGDSAYIFISFASNLKDALSTDKLIFQTQDQSQSVSLTAFIRDAYFLTDTFVACDTTFTKDKAIVVDGPLFVPEGCTLTIQAGTHLYFTSRKDESFTPASYLIVSGTLRVVGTPTDPVIFEGNRLDPDYMEKGGQWLGLYFSKSSSGSEIRHATIKNAIFGIRTDSMALNTQPKVRLIQTWIRNMEYFGVWMVGYASPSDQSPVVLAENVLISNCAKHALRVDGGGIAEFRHSTLASYNYDFNRKDPLIFLNNFGTQFAYPLNITFRNSVIHGTEKSEVKLDDAGIAGAFTVLFDHCLLKQEENLPGNDNIYSTEPGFVNARERDYRPNSSSALIDKGANLSVFTDLANEIRPKLNGYDIGCYEFQP